MFDAPLWTQVLGLATAILGTIAATSKVADRLLKVRREKGGQHALLRGALAATALHTIMDRMHAQRALLIRAHNGGGPLDPAKRTYSSAEMEARRQRIPKRIESWKDRPIDAHYIALLQRISTEDHVIVYTAKLPKDSILRGCHESDGVKASIYFRLWNTDRDFYFVGVDIDEESQVNLTPTEMEGIRNARTALCGLLRDKRVINL